MSSHPIAGRAVVRLPSKALRSRDLVSIRDLKPAEVATILDLASLMKESIVFDQAENRMHVQKAILMLLLGGVRRFAARSAHA